MFEYIKATVYFSISFKKLKENSNIKLFKYSHFLFYAVVAFLKMGA
jgi:hypothetical protein